MPSCRITDRYFGLASADVNDDPVPKLWAEYVPTRLAVGTKLGFAFGIEYVSLGTKAIVAHLVDRLPDYEAIDVRYVVVPTDLYPFGRGPRFKDGVATVYRDPQIAIYALPHPVAYFRTKGSHCHLAPANRELVTVRCAGPATLVRSGLALPGWSATINGHTVPITQVDGGLTSVRLPAGTSKVSFTYLPPHEDIAILVFALGVLSAIGVPLFAGCRRRRRVLGACAADNTPRINPTEP